MNGYTVKLPSELAEKMKLLADAFDMTGSEVIRIALRGLRVDDMAGYLDGQRSGRIAKFHAQNANYLHVDVLASGSKEPPNRYRRSRKMTKHELAEESTLYSNSEIIDI